MVSYDEQGFNFAFAILDSRMSDGSDPKGRSLNEFLEVTAVAYD